MSSVAGDHLMHYGIGKLDGAPGRGSGRYPLGSGKNPNQHSGDFLSRVEKLRKEGFTYTDEDGKVWTGDTAIAKSMGLKTSQFRTQLSLANSERRAGLVKTAKELREKGLSLNEIAREMGFSNDSSVRSLLNENSEARMKKAQATAEFLKEQVAKKGMIDVGAGVERELGVSKEKLKEALYILELEGYPTYGGGVPQVTNPGKQTNIQVLCPPGTEHREIYNFGEVHSLRDYVSHDGGDTFDRRFVYPKSMDSSRLQICYAEDGGIKKDGVIEIRRGVADLSLGESRYAQVRILVDDTRYIKGMAVYADDLPDGIDVRFNTNKSKDVPKLEVLKKIKNDPDNPFGSLIKAGVVDPDDPLSAREGGQSYYYDSKGVKQLSLINKRAEEGDWGEWADKLPSQFLSKQNKQLIRRQLTIAADDKKAEFEEICSLVNPTVKKKLLQSYADDCDAAAVHLKAAALPRQKYQVILPLTSIKDTEVYAPNFNDGEQVALIRYPHGGTFEIPILTVNNKQPEGRRVLGTAPKDAVGINSKVAERLSGADFDGDTVMVIPTGGKVKITSTPPLKGLIGFDPKLEYGADSSTVDADGNEHYYRGGKEFRVMRNTQTEMGIVSNLITDMTLRGAPPDELARAVRHSMVVIDAEKHHLDYKQSEVDNQISALKKRYQGTREPDGTYHEGAATLISRAKSEVQVVKRRGSPMIDPNTGEQSWKEVQETYVDKDGRTRVRTQASTKMAETRDAMTLVSDARTPAELAYAEYANQMKSLANKARLEMVNTGKIAYSSSARAAYQGEVSDLMDQLNVALLNAPRERQAQVMANATVAAKRQDNPDMTKAEVKKERQRALAASRAAVGAGRELVKISDRQWEAIQAGAISENVLKQILDNSDIDVVKQLAMPRTTTTLTPAKLNKLKVMYESGNYTTYQIAQSLGISSSTVSRYLNGKE